VLCFGIISPTVYDQFFENVYMDENQIIIGLVWYVVFVFSTSCHEAAHAFAAMKLGDYTGYNNGQVTLHPFAHIRQSPVGMVVVPIISFVLGGWMFGWASCPYDPEWARLYPKRETVMSLAGPAANLLLVIIAAIAIRVGIGMGIFYLPESITMSRLVGAETGTILNSAAIMLSVMFTLNLFLCIFNMMPVPQLDGGSLLKMLVNKTSALQYQNLLANPTFMIVTMIVAWRAMGYIASPVHNVAVNILFYPVASYH